MRTRLLALLLLFCVPAFSCSGSESEPEPTPKPVVPPDDDDDDDDDDGDGDKNYIYYVAVDGSDANDGTINAPFAGIDYALSKAHPGDIVYLRGGVYNQKVTFPRSGTPDKRITLSAYGDEVPVLDGGGMTVGSTEALVRISGVSHIDLRGLEVRNLRQDSPGGEPNGIIVEAGATNVTVSGCHVHHIESNIALDEGRSAHAILVIGNTDTPLRNIVVEGNTIHDCKTGYSENLTINGYVDGFTISGNTIYNCENIAIDAAGGYWANSVQAYNYARNGVICDNTVFNVENSRGPIGGYGAIGIYADGSRFITIERNRVFDCDRGIGIVSETDDYPTTGCIVRNNLVYNCWRTGIYTGGYLNFTGGGTSDCYIVNNTLVGNNRVVGYYDEYEGELRLTENSRNNFFYNNLICSAHADNLFVHKYTSTGSANLFDNNMYCGPGGWMWEKVNGDMIRDFGQWQAACGSDASSIRMQERHFPAVVPDRRAEFTLPEGSPARGGGKFVSAYIHGAIDFAGNPRSESGTISIGAYQ